ncbi:MAG: PIG-L family deacetylase [Thermoanaerobaculia bacterium]
MTIPGQRIGLLGTLGAATLTALFVASPAARGTGPQVLPSVLEPAGTGGTAALDRALAKLATSKRLLVVGAHPDDEDTALLAAISLGQGGEAAYLALSRGEGGQNLIGPELGVGLGLVRSQELLAARRVDGARQYFSRAFDFGYTRSLDETLRFWPKETLLEDVVRILRRFKPQVLVSVFANDASGGHGQHQAAGHVAYEAFHLAGEAGAIPALADENLAPWSPAALWRTSWFNPDAATAKIQMGALEPFSGHSLLQLAMSSRGQHRSQDMGRLLELGPREGGWIFVEGAPGTDGKDFWSGIDTSLAGLAASAPPALAAAIRPLLASAGAHATAARSAMVAPAGAERERVADEVAAALADLRSASLATEACAAASCRATAELLTEKTVVAESALALACGLAIDAASDREALPPGDALAVTLTLWNTGGAPIAVRRAWIEGEVAPGTALPIEAGRSLAPGELGKWETKAAVPDDARLSRPYFLTRPMVGDLYDWSAAPPLWRGEPFEPPPFGVAVELQRGAATFVVRREIVARTADQVKGEIRRPLRVVPPVEVKLAPETLVWPLGRSAPALELEIQSNLAAPVEGKIVLAGEGCVAAREMPFRVAEPRGEARLSTAAPDCSGNRPGRFAVAGRATLADGRRSDGALPLVDYPHIRPQVWPHEATTTVVRADIRWPRLDRVGYVVGAADRVPAALESIGVPLERLSAAALESGDFARFDAIVVGSRAYESEPALPRAQPRLLDWVRSGGLLLVQYQQYPFIEGKFAPLPMEIARPHDRITDETAPVRILAPAHPVFLRPNRIEAADWEGWVQERALYLPHSWDPGYSPLLAMTDPDQPEQQGALLVAPLGKGTYVYTGIAFFRELPAGVPGAYRLFANLLALAHPNAGGEKP